MYLANIPSPLGMLTALADDNALTGLWMEGQRKFGRKYDLDHVQMELSPVLEQLQDWLTRYFAGQLEPFPGLVRPQGSAFDQQVWALLREIPAGESRTYGQLAAVLRSSPRAVGGAVGRNPISIVIPCHRVLAADGRLGGYAGGREGKLFLVAEEPTPYPKKKPPHGGKRTGAAFCVPFRKPCRDGRDAAGAASLSTERALCACRGQR